MKTMPFRTIRGRGHPPSEVSGFYELQEAPWRLVMIATGTEILSPIVNRFNELEGEGVALGIDGETKHQENVKTVFSRGQIR